MHADLTFALELADLADAVTVERFLADDLAVETKPDLSPVTEADRAGDSPPPNASGGGVGVGVGAAPALPRRWGAARGEGAFANGRRIHVSQVADLGDAVLSYASLGSWEQHGLGEQFLDLARRCWRTRGFGDFWSHMLVAEGAADVAVEPEVELWDLAAPQVIVEEAGGRFTDLGGTPTPAGGSVVSSNGLLHDQVLTTLRP